MVNEEASRPRLVGWLPMALGVLLIVVGAVWALQGINVLTDGAMSNDSKWGIIGAVVAVIGLILIILGVRSRSRSKRPAVVPDSDQAATPDPV